MDKLIFINNSGQEIEFGPDMEYSWLNVDDFGENTGTQQTVSSPYQDGVTATGDFYFDSKLIAVDIVILSDDPKASFRTLNNRLNPKLGIGQLHYYRDNQVYILEDVKVKSLPTMPGRERTGDNYQFSRIIFEVYNPLYVTEERSTQLVSRTLDWTFPVQITSTFTFSSLSAEGVAITNNGDVATPIEARFQGPVTAPLTLTNELTGDKIVTSLDIATDETLIITTEDDNIDVRLLDEVSGTTVSAFAYIDVTETTFFKLSPGVNSLSLTSGAATQGIAIIKYKPRYVGV